MLNTKLSAKERKHIRFEICASAEDCHECKRLYRKLYKINF